MPRHRMLAEMPATELADWQAYFILLEDERVRATMENQSANVAQEQRRKLSG